MIDLGTELLPAAQADVIGLAVLRADRTVQQKVGHLVEWLPAVGADCCLCPLLVGMEAEMAALSEGRRDLIALSGVRAELPGLDRPVTAVVVWNGDQSRYVVIAMPDFTARQAEIMFESERRARRLMEQQLEAASSEVRFASLARTRLRLARDLHDTLVHSIIALLTQIRLTRHFLATDPARVSEGLAIAEEAAINGLARARDAIARLRMPDEPELGSDIEGMLSDFARQTGAELSVRIDDEARAGLRDHAVTLQRIVGEALRNIEAHAKARQVRFDAIVEEAAGSRRLLVDIRDDGRGFDGTTSRPGHFGLIGMAEFAELAAGECTVESSPGAGTLVRVSLPLTAPAMESGHGTVGTSKR
ncbi:sensor histidine kinase [Mesorhizobium captivum]|uniref:sensor histidine kinase n=1 Tax=Mesorhizobium captivum TaxID=3072319 RepID=UPI002A239E60|nr:histidine kinase [Mesorhizobium sp. VK23E]MDX8513371.1 histidine kinase [Mesorhizobium sp. VK23E]